MSSFPFPRLPSDSGRIDTIQGWTKSTEPSSLHRPLAIIDIQHQDLRTPREQMISISNLIIPYQSYKVNLNLSPTPMDSSPSTCLASMSIHSHLNRLLLPLQHRPTLRRINTRPGQVTRQSRLGLGRSPSLTLFSGCVSV